MRDLFRQAWQEAAIELGAEMGKHVWARLTLVQLTPRQETQSRPFKEYMDRMYRIYKENGCQW